MTSLIVFLFVQYFVLGVILSVVFIHQDSPKCNKAEVTALFIIFAMFWPAICTAKIIAEKVGLD
jgi:hypothetical protein